MSLIPIAGPPRRATFAVLPVVDYEPPTRAVPRCRQSSHAPLHPPTPRINHRAVVGASDPRDRPPVVTAPMSATMRQAAAFADAALRRVLEVLDRRRPPAQLRSLLTPGLVEAVLSLTPAVTGEGAAVLRRMRLQPVFAAGNATESATESAAEVFGAYSRGDRIHAIACRVERTPGRWLIVALQIG